VQRRGGEESWKGRNYGEDDGGRLYFDRLSRGKWFHYFFVLIPVFLKEIFFFLLTKRNSLSEIPEFSYTLLNFMLLLNQFEIEVA